jgi:hypothetical protein
MAEGIVDDVETRRVEAALRAVLPLAAELRLARAAGPAVELTVNGHRLRARWAGEGWLRQIRPILDAKTDRPDVVVARRMSPGARAALGNERIGWVDESGAAEIAAGTLVVSRSGRRDASVAKPAHWTPAVLAVAEAVLCGVPPTVAATGAASGLSTGSCTNALRTLTDLGLLVADVPRGRGAARRVADADHLLDAYASSAGGLAPKESLQVGVTWRDAVSGLAEVGRGFDAAGVVWAATGAAASMVIAPFLTGVSTADVYVDAGTVAQLEAVTAQIGLRPIDGGRLTLRPFPTASTRRLAGVADGLRVAPWPRVYADTRATGVRGEEAAEHLREVVRGR